MKSKGPGRQWLMQRPSDLARHYCFGSYGIIHQRQQLKSTEHKQTYWPTHLGIFIKTTVKSFPVSFNSVLYNSVPLFLSLPKACEAASFHLWPCDAVPRRMNPLEAKQSHLIHFPRLTNLIPDQFVLYGQAVDYAALTDLGAGYRLTNFSCWLQLVHKTERKGSS
jgi:hypothetical protein